MTSPEKGTQLNLKYGIQKAKAKAKTKQLTLYPEENFKKIIAWRGKVELLNPEQNSSGRKWKKRKYKKQKFNKNYLMNLKKTASAEHKLQIENGVRILYTHT